MLWRWQRGIARACRWRQDGAVIPGSKRGLSPVIAAFSLLLLATPAQAAPPTFQAISAIAAAASGGADPTVTLPAHAANDILLLATIVRSNTATVATPAGWTQIGSPTVRGTIATYQFFWKRAAGGAETNPLINRTGTTGDVYAAVITYRGAITTGDPWEVKGTAATGTADPSVFTGISTLTADSLLVVAVAGEDNNNASIITTGTDPSAYTEHYVESATGADGVITFSEFARTAAGPTGNVSVNWNTAVPIGFGGIVLALKPAPTTFDQSAYRLFNNANSTDVGTALAALNTAATLGATGAAFRLRMLLHVAGSNLAISGQAFKLQFAARSGTCDTAFSGETYADVTAASVIAYNNNATPADAATLTANANDPTHGGDTVVNQTYEEVNNFTNPAAIIIGQDGKWDFSLIDNGAPASTTYCFRAVKSTGTVLDTYAVIPEITTAPLVPTPGSFNAFETSTAAGAITGVIRTKVAGSAFSLDVVAIASGAQQAGFTDAVIVELLGNNTLGVALDAQNCPTSSTLVQSVAPNPTVTGGRSTVNFAAVVNAWKDVRVRVRWPTSAPTVTSCSTDNFAIRPSGITVSVTDATWTTPGGARILDNTAASGGTVHKAGQPFRVTAVAAPGSATQYDGSPTVLTGACLTLAGMTGCSNGTFNVPGGGWSGAGTRVNDSATYSEAGALTLELEDQNFASVDAADSTLAERTVPQAGGAIQVGRFVPDHFIVAPHGAAPAPQFQTFGSACAGVRSFTYIGQPFGYVTPPQVLVTARNSAGGNTTNYRDSLWKITTAAPTDITQTYDNNSVGPAIDASAATNAPTVLPLNDGTGTVTVNSLDRILYTRSLTTPVAQFNADISLTISARDDSEADGQITTTTATPFTTIAFDSGNQFRYGRLRIGNANGSQLVPLPVPMETQYYSGAPANAFFTNTADNCTTLAGTNITMGNFQGSLGPLASCKTNMNANITFTAGRGNLLLTAPGSANGGSVDLTLQLGTGAFGSTSCVTPGSPPPQATNGANRAYLQGNWTGGNFDQNPTGRAAFGVFKGAEEVIFIRENF